MAMGAPVVATPQAVEGLEDCNSDELLTAEESSDFARKVTAILDRKYPEMGARARSRVAKDYRWKERLAVLDQVLASAAKAHRGGPTELTM